MERRELIALLDGGALARPLSARAQQRIGFDVPSRLRARRPADRISPSRRHAPKSASGGGTTDQARAK
jgi:hypothetical protein